MIKYKMDLRNPVKRLKLCLRADSRVSESTPAVSESTPKFQSRLPQKLQHCMSCDTLPSRLPKLPSRLPQSKTVQIIRMRSSWADSTSVGVVSQVRESSPILPSHLSQGITEVRSLQFTMQSRLRSQPSHLPSLGVVSSRTGVVSRSLK